MVQGTAVSEANPDAIVLPYSSAVASASAADGVRPAVLILPGGGYQALSDVEAEPIAEFFAAHGYRAFILRYSIGDRAQYPAPLLEASRAIWEIRRDAERFGVDPDRIAIVGFSAGAHVATMLATLWNDPVSRVGTDVPPGGNRPNASVTGYTPTTFENFEENTGLPADSPFGPRRLLAQSGRFSDYPALTSHALVNPGTPPAFLWKTTADLPEDSYAYARALAELGIAHEVHVFGDSARVAAGALTEPAGYSANTALWGRLAVNWLETVLDQKESDR